MKGGVLMSKTGMKLAAIMLVVVMMFSQMVFAEAEPVITIKGEGVENVVSFTLEELKALPEEAQIEEEYLYNSKGGEKTVLVKGVSLAYVLEELAVLKVEEAEVAMVAADGYPIDPQELSNIMSDAFKYVIAYEIDGEPVEFDDPDVDVVNVYRKVVEEGEFGTVFKFVAEITVGEETTPVEEPETEEPETEEPETEEPETEEPETEEPEETVVPEFTDITEDFEYAREAIEAMAAKGIINGMAEGIYAPEGNFTRAQFCKIAVLSLGYELVDYEGGFSDVGEADWFAPYVQAAVDNGLFEGYPDGTFKPNQEINRQEMAVVAGRAAVKAEVVTREHMEKFVLSKSDFEDKDLIPQWAEHEVAWLESELVFAGVAVDKFEPVKIVNRAEAAVVVYNTLFSK